MYKRTGFINELKEWLNLYEIFNKKYKGEKCWLAGKLLLNLKRKLFKQKENILPWESKKTLLTAQWSKVTKKSVQNNNWRDHVPLWMHHLKGT